MKPRYSIQLKAAFLLIVFALNAIVGFACSIGIDMGFNPKHHGDQEATGPVIHIHEDGKKHIHQEKRKSNNDEKVDQHDEKDTVEAVAHTHKNGQKHIHHEQKKSNENDEVSHHSEGEATEAVAHIHKKGQKHIQHEKKESRSHNKSHKHEETKRSENSKSDEGNCCTDEVKQFQQLDKSIPTSLNVIHPVFFTAFVAVYYNVTLLPHTDVVRDIKPFVRSYHPPIPDIRIAIQSFQI